MSFWHYDNDELHDITMQTVKTEHVGKITGHVLIIFQVLGENRSRIGYLNLPASILNIITSLENRKFSKLPIGPTTLSPDQYCLGLPGNCKGSCYIKII